MNWIRNNLKIAVPGAIVGLGVLAFLAFRVFGIHTKFIDDEVSEGVPVFDSGAASAIPALRDDRCDMGPGSKYRRSFDCAANP